MDSLEAEIGLAWRTGAAGNTSTTPGTRTRSEGQSMQAQGAPLRRAARP